MEYRIHRGTETYGPYNLEEIKEYLQTQSVVPSDVAENVATGERVLVSALTGNNAPPPIPPRTVVQANTPDSTGGIIPYKNSSALVAYYLGVFSLIPILGALLGLVALVLGIMGFRNYRKNPVIGGAVHAWIGIILGGGIALLHLVGFIVLVVGAGSA